MRDRSCWSSIGRLATASSIWRSCAGFMPCGTLTSPAAIARSSSAELSAIERSERVSVAEALRDGDLSAIFGVTSKVTLEKVLTTVLAVFTLAVDTLVGRENAHVPDDGLGRP